jgi:mono/diheme cytochrome c family protein
MRGTIATGLALLGVALVAAVLIAVGLYRWDTAARATEASLRPEPVAPLAAPPPPRQAIAAVASPQLVAASASLGDAAAGQARFQTACNPCHPSARAGIGPALSGASFTERYPDDAAVAAVVRSGRRAMPAFRPDQLSDQDLTNIIAYVRSLAAAPAAAASPVTQAEVSPVAAAPGSPAIGPAGGASPSASVGPTPLSQEVLTSISPGLSSYMLETAKRMGRSWFAGQAGSWDEAAFEVREARAVLQQGGGRSSATRQQALQAFNDGFMTPLAAAAQSGDRSQYEAAYRTTIDACNACHASQTYGAINQPFSFIRVQVPTKSIWDVYAYAR